MKQNIRHGELEGREKGKPDDNPTYACIISALELPFGRVWASALNNIVYDQAFLYW